ncbi:MAG TPA: hypothetical protein VFP86_00885 [bacterium]|nr:hypothetical protein [bacterium]
MLKLEERSAPRLPVAAGVSLALLFSALAFHLLFFRRAKRGLGF